MHGTVKLPHIHESLNKQYILQEQCLERLQDTSAQHSSEHVIVYVLGCFFLLDVIGFCVGEKLLDEHFI
jgi:hypothetical protein